MHKDVHTSELSENEEMYLETLFTLAEQGRIARTTELAQESGVAPASVTEMMQKLGRLGYVDYKPFQAVSLTAKGRQHATKIIRIHRLLELFFTQRLHIPAERARREACALEHAAPPEFEQWLCRELAHPATGAADAQIPPGKCCPPTPRAAGLPRTRHDAGTPE